MKTKMMIVLAILFSLQTFGQTVGHIFLSGGLKFRITSATEVEVASNSAALVGSIAIPATVTDNSVTYTVTGVGALAFRNCTLVTDVVIPKTVSYIGFLSFGQCSGLTFVDIPNSVLTIGNDAFKQCTALPSITLPIALTSLGVNAFQSCTALNSIVIPNSITSISDGTFQGCSALMSVSLPNTLLTIGREAFQHCSALTTFTIPTSVTSIGEEVFEECTGLTEITIPDSVTRIQAETFNLCAALKTINLPCTLTDIGFLAFGACRSLTSVNIPMSVTQISQAAFQDCTGLVSFAVNWASPLNINRNVFDRVTLAPRTLYVPFGTEAMYDAAAVWTEFGNINEPLSALGTSLTVCNATTVADLIPPGSGFNWYITATGGIALPVTNSITSGTYYVSRTSNCVESNRVKVTVKINSTPAPTARPQLLLTGSTVGNLMASGVNLQWYATPSGGTNLSSATYLTSNIYYVSQTINNCESQRTAVSITVVIQPTVSYCQNVPAVALASPFAVGTVARWYRTVIGGTASITAPIPTTSTVGRRIFFVSIVVNGVETNRIPYHVDILGIPAAVGAITGVASQGALVGTAIPAVYTVAAVANATVYNWTVPTGVNIVSGQGTTTLTINFSNVTAGAGSIGNLMVVAENAQGCSTRLARILTLTKALPTAPTAIRMTDAALATSITGIPTAITNISRYIGTTTVLTLTATPVTDVTTYEWELPAGVNVLSGATITRGGALGSNVITVNFASITPSSMFNFTTASGLLTHVLRVGAKSVTGVGASVTNNASLINPATTSTARLLTLTATSPRAASSIRMTDALAVDPTRAITNISTFIGTNKELTLTATPSTIATGYIWELPKGATQLSGGNSNIISVNFANVSAGTTSLYLGVKAMNGIGESVTNNATLVPATTSTARLLRLTATIPSAVPAVMGQVWGICGKNAYTYTITPSALATFYQVSAPSGAIITSKSKESNKSNLIQTSDLEFLVTYPENFFTSKQTPASLAVWALNGIGQSLTARILNVSSSIPTPTDLSHKRGKGRHRLTVSDEVRDKLKRTTSLHQVVSLNEQDNGFTYIWSVSDGVELISGQGTSSIEIDYSTVLPNVKSIIVSMYVKNNCGVVTLPITRTIVLEPDTTKTAASVALAATEVYPNPVFSVFNVDVTASATGSLTMTVYSLDGNMAMNSKTVALQEGTNTITENVSSLVKGVYIIQLVNTSNNEIITKKLIKD